MNTKYSNNGISGAKISKHLPHYVRSLYSHPAPVYQLADRPPRRKLLVNLLIIAYPQLFAAHIN